MIIWGSKAITGKTGGGNFNCPMCAAPKPFEQKRVRRFFTLYFIPLFPTSTLGEYVECTGCQGTFEPAVLNYDPSVASQQTEAIFMVAVKQMMIAICLADGVVDDGEVAQIQTIYERLTGARVSEQDLREEIAEIASRGAPLFDLIDHLIGQLNDHGRETAISSAYLIAAADGNVEESEMALLQEIAARMGMSPAHLQGVIAGLHGPVAGG
jgi:tellurite resistance protein